jgi:hypothetical protein
MSEILISNLISQQLPNFIRDDNPKFVLFLEKYYEWLEQSNNAIGQIESLYNSKDLDLVDNFYLNEIVKEILPNFPQDTLFDKSKFIKYVGQFYRSKGTPESVKFLFRILYDENIEIYFPKEQIIKASDGKWVLPLALRVETGDQNIFDIEKTKITGEVSKATAIVEKVIKSVDRQLGIEYIELYISNVNKLFATGENVTTTIVQTGGNTSIVSAKLIGSLSEIKIDPNNRGLFYNGYDPALNYEGDPVTIVGGLNPSSNNPIGAIATVGNVLRGSVTEVFVDNGGFGFRDPSVNLNSSIIDFVGGFSGGVLGSEAKGKILLLDSGTHRTLNVSNVTIEGFYSSNINSIDNVSNTKTINELTTKQSLNVFPVSFISVESSGGGYRNKPNVEIYSLYMEELDDELIINSTTAVQGTNLLRDETQDLTQLFETGESVKLFLVNRFEEVKIIANVSSNTITFNDFFENDINNLQVYKIKRRKLDTVGSLGRINIVNGGDGYAAGDYLVFSSNGRGYGANAEVTAVHSANGGIKTIRFNETNSYVRGGEGYTMLDLPTVTVDSQGGGANAVLVVSEILGEGYDFDLSTSRIGAISSLRVTSFGYDYVEAPTISLRNADITLSNVTEGQLFVSNTRIYQGASNTTASWYAFVDKYDTNTKLLRVFNYSGIFNRTLTIKSDDNVVSGNVVTSVFYGDGKARATAVFENGLIRYPGIYLNTDGQPSSDQKIQDDEKYHNFSYVINTENDYRKFKKTLKEVAHPVGTKTFVVRIDTNTKKVANSTVDTIYLTQSYVSNTFNIANSTNNMIVTSSLNVVSEVSVGDYVVLKNLSKQITGTGNVVSSSNVLTGNGTNFINDINDGQTLFLSSGNTVTVRTVANANSVVLYETINITETDVTINVRFDSTKKVNSVNANTILVDTNFDTTNNYVSTIVQKVR